MGDITGLYLFQVSICKTLEVDELDHLALQGNKGQLDWKGSKGILGRENNKDRYEGKNENCKTPTVNAVEGENETRFVISVCMFQ